jgi:hypothetical protein
MQQGSPEEAGQLTRKTDELLSTDLMSWAFQMTPFIFPAAPSMYNQY